MFAKERQDCIVDLVNQDGKVFVKDLSQKFHVTEDCIRKDLSLLESQGLLKKAYGGAIRVRLNPHLYNSEQRKSIPNHERVLISQKAVSLLQDKDIIYLDISLTSLEIAYQINELSIHLTVITNMIDILNILNHCEHITLIFIGGTLNQEGDGFWDQLAIQRLKSFKIDKAFLGVVGVNIGNGQLSTYYVDDGFMKASVIEQSRLCYLLCEERKFNEEGNFVFSSLYDIDGLIVSNEDDIQNQEQLKQYELIVI